MSLQPKGLPEIPEQTAAVARAAFPDGSLPIRVRDRLAEVFADEPFAQDFGVRGAPGLSPAVLSLVTVLQFTENLSDRQAAAMAVRAIDWKYALGARLTDTGFDSTVLKATAAIQHRLAERDLKPAEHYLNSGYSSAALVAAADREGVTMVTPMLADTSAQARAAEGFDKAAFRIDWRARQATCPQGVSSSGWCPVTQHGREAIVVYFAAADCRRCPAQARCTSSASGNRMLTLQPKEHQQALDRARERQQAHGWRAKYALRSAQASKAPSTRPWTSPESAAPGIAACRKSGSSTPSPRPHST